MTRNLVVALLKVCKVMHIYRRRRGRESKQDFVLTPSVQLFDDCFIVCVSKILKFLMCIAVWHKDYKPRLHCCCLVGNVTQTMKYVHQVVYILHSG
jgi:hypothetical protein